VGFDGLLVGTSVGKGTLVGLGVGCNDGSFAKMLNRGWEFAVAVALASIVDDTVVVVSSGDP
jgi:hypothetical protein